MLSRLDLALATAVPNTKQGGTCRRWVPASRFREYRHAGMADLRCSVAASEGLRGDELGSLQDETFGHVSAHGGVAETVQ